MLSVCLLSCPESPLSYPVLFISILFLFCLVWATQLLSRNTFCFCPGLPTIPRRRRLCTISARARELTCSRECLQSSAFFSLSLCLVCAQSPPYTATCIHTKPYRSFSQASHNLIPVSCTCYDMLIGCQVRGILKSHFELGRCNGRNFYERIEMRHRRVEQGITPTS